MKSVTLKKRDFQDIINFIDFVTQERSGSVEFKQIVSLSKLQRAIKDAMPEFCSKLEIIQRDNHALNEAGRKKLMEFRQKMLEQYPVHQTEGQEATLVTDEMTQKIMQYKAELQQSINDQINETIQPRIKELYESEGEEQVLVEFGSNAHKAFSELFETHAKDAFTNTKKMVEIYEAVVGELPEEE